MRVHADRIDKVVHKFPGIILELKKLEQEMMELKQDLLKSIKEDEDEDEETDSI